MLPEIWKKYWVKKVLETCLRSTKKTEISKVIKNVFKYFSILKTQFVQKKFHLRSKWCLSKFEIWWNAFQIISLIFFIFFVVVRLCLDVPLVQESTSNHLWSMTNKAEEFLSNGDIQNRLVHIVGIGGPTRTGKSYLMSTLLERFVQEDGKIHFGIFFLFFLV